MLKILVVDDDDSTLNGIVEALLGAGHDVADANHGEEAISLLASQVFDLVISDIRMPRLDGMSLFRWVRRESPGTAVVLMTSFARIPDVVGTLRDGALDFVTKPFDAEEFAKNVVGPIAERREQSKRFEAARSQYVGREAGGEIVGESLAIRKMTERANVVAQSDASVVVVGEAGTGKKLLARTLHAAGPRKGGPFFVVPCASLLELVRESELTDLSEMRTRGSRDGWFRAAEGGTLVLEGIETIPRSVQTSLLRVLDEPTLQAQRSRDWQPLGVRVVSLTSEDPSKLIDDRGFLPALFFRLNATQLSVPPLRARNGDLYLLVSHLLRRLSPPGVTSTGLTPNAWQALSSYPFPGNLRELAWAIEHALVAANGHELDVHHLPAPISARGSGESEPEDGPTTERGADADSAAVSVA